MWRGVEGYFIFHWTNTGNTGTDFKIEYSKKHLYTEHLSSAYYILVSKIAC